MKYMSKIALSFLLMFSLTGCMWGDDDKKETDKVKDDVKDTGKDVKDDVDGTIDDVMDYFKGEGVEYSNDKKLEKTDWGAYEGSSFRYDNQDVYLYRVNSNEPQVSGMLESAKANNRIGANQNGKEMQYGASVNGSYLLVYDMEAKVDRLVELFNKYEMKQKDDMKEDAK